MTEEKIKNVGNVLYITGYGNDSNETTVYALTMPVNITAHIDIDGSALVQFKGKQDDGLWQTVCQTGVVPDVEPPSDFEKVKKELEEAVAKTVAGWITVYMRDGIFCTDKGKMTFSCQFDLRDVMVRLQKNLEEVYAKYKGGGE